MNPPGLAVGARQWRASRLMPPQRGNSAAANPSKALYQEIPSIAEIGNVGMMPHTSVTRMPPTPRMQ
eukprot:5680574-Pyramimonas_sp.AAC.1